VRLPSLVRINSTLTNISKTAGLWRMFLLTRNLRKNGWRMPIPI
jgi:hypothetical protein